MNSGTYIKGESILRVLEDDDSNVLVIDCQKRSIPFLINKDALFGYEVIDKESCIKLLKVSIPNYENLGPNEKKIVHERYGTISSIIPVVGDQCKRAKLINHNAQIYSLSKVTIRKRLCEYLVFDDICVFAPSYRKKRKL